MQHLWIALGATVALVVVALPVAAIILVSMASLREESAHSITGEAPGPGERMARRLLGFHNSGQQDNPPLTSHHADPWDDSEDFPGTLASQASQLLVSSAR